MTIAPEALEKARILVANYGSDPDGLLVGAIAAALQAAHDAAAPKLPDDLAGLVKELRDAAHLNAGPLGPEARAEHRAATAIQSLVARIGELEAGLHGLLNCPDIADNDYKDEETHAAERRARSLLNKDRQP
jgi:hypothetical protein